MIVSQLIAILEDVDPDAEVLVVHQESWPLRFHVHGVYDAAADEQPCSDHDRVNCEDCGPAEPDTNVYVVEGDHPDDNPYGPRAAWENATTTA